jgi:hypothetical protein
MDANKELAKQNSFKIVGDLVEVNLDNKTSGRTGKDFISGKIVIKSLINGRQQLTEVELYSNKFKQDGTANKLFDTYANLGALLNKRVRVSGELGESRFFSTQNSQLVSTVVNRGRYVAAADTGEKDTVDFSFAGYIVKPLYEKNSKDGQLVAYEMLVAQANWNNTKPNLIKFTVAKENKTAIAAIQRLYEKGMTVSVRGNISIISEDVEVSEKTAFGESTRVYHNTYKNYLIQTGSQPLDKGAYSPQDILELTRAYDDDGIAIQNAAKGQVATGKTTTGGKTTTAAPAPAKTPRTSLL